MLLKNCLIMRQILHVVTYIQAHSLRFRAHGRIEPLAAELAAGSFIITGDTRPTLIQPSLEPCVEYLRLIC